MRNVAALTKRELLAWFVSPMAYVVLTVFLLLSGYAFYNSLVTSGEATLRPMVEFVFLLLLVISPMLTMRLFADEFQSGTVEALFTAPVTTAEVVLSKYAAALIVLLVLLVGTMGNAAALFVLGEPDGGLVVAGYLGLVLLGSCFLAIGLVASACVRMQISAAVVTIVVLLSLLVLPLLVPKAATQPVAAALRYLSYSPHFEDFTRGVVDTRGVGYFLLADALCLFLSVVIVSARRRRGL